jgi:hypothetical protein
MGLRCVFTIERQSVVGIHHPLSMTHSSGANFVEPDRVQNAQQPAVHAGARDKLPGTFKRPHAGGLHQVFGDMPLPRQQQAIAP